MKKAKEINPGNPNILRAEIIASLRCNQNPYAYALLNTYMNNLNDSMKEITDKESRTYTFLNSEYEWARKMTIKVKGL